MKVEQYIVLGAGVALVAMAAFVEARSGRLRKGVEINTDSLKIGLTYPKIWLYYNDSEVNAREWADFGARSGHVLNIPILNLFYQSIVSANRDYKVEVINGLTGVKELLGEDALPTNLRKFGASVNVAEEDWIRTAVLAKFGGLWLSPSIVALKGFGPLPADKIVAFGMDDVPMYSSSCPGFRALWVPRASHPLMVKWEQMIKNRLNTQLGGLQVRGDAKSDWMNMFSQRDDVIIGKGELSRNPKTQKKLELEDIFATSVGTPRFEVPCDAVYLVVPFKDLMDRRQFGWVLKSSEEEILESELVISGLMRKSAKASSNLR
jgi:hypothetical protein